MSAWLAHGGTGEEPGPECVCGAELREIPLPEDVALASGMEGILVHVESGDTRCYPDAKDDSAKATAEVIT